MQYRAIGIMSGSSLDGLDIAYVEIEDKGGEWSYQIIASECVGYDTAMQNELRNAVALNAYDYLLLHTSYGHYIGECVQKFIDKYSLHHKVQLISSHGHTVFHAPEKNMTAQIGDGASIAAITGINTISDLRAIDIALNGQGAPIVPVGDKFLLKGYDYYLNLGGIANISQSTKDSFIAFDICPANRVLDMLAQTAGKNFDAGGALASSGKVHDALLSKLNEEEYYLRPYPKSLANDFGTHTIFPLIQSFQLNPEDALRTYTEHIAQQICSSIQALKNETTHQSLLVTGGGAFNQFLVQRLSDTLLKQNVAVVIPDEITVQYKEALIMAFLGILRWREENTVLATVTGAIRNSIGGAVWMGQEA